MRILPIAATIAAIAVAPANAATVVGATSIQITNALSDYLQVAEVVANDYSSADVSAASAGATASANDMYASFSTADKAIDGNTGGNYYTDTIYHGLGSGGSTLTINLAGPSSLSSLTIFGRTDCCQQRDLYNVSIFGAGNSLLFSGQLDARYTPGTLTFDIAAVPEPATWGLMIAGFAMTGFAARRRRVALAA